MSLRPRGRTAERPKLISAEMSTMEASGRIFFSILNIKETRKRKCEIILYFIMVYIMQEILALNAILIVFYSFGDFGQN